MKKLMFAALAIAAMAACTKSNVEFEQQNEIAFQPVSQKATKAAVVGTYYPIEDAYNFNVWAWWGDKPANTPEAEIASFNTVYINDQTFENRDYVLWGGLGKSYYWPTTGSLYFAGYSPASIQGLPDDSDDCEVSYDRNNKILTIKKYQQSSNISETVDLMWFHLTDKSYDRTTPSVPVQFHHALSWLSFRFNLEHPYTPTDWTVKSVKLTGIETKGNFTAVKTGTSSQQGNAEWKDLTNTVDELLVYNKAGGYPVAYVTNDYDPLANDPSVLENTKNGVLVLPQSCAPTDASLVIEFEQKAPSENSVPQTKTLSLGGESDSWLPGKHYIYTITFGAEEILIAPTVVDWDPEDNLAVPVK